jgi:DNA-binding FadR family transcriptional regulator
MRAPEFIVREPDAAAGLPQRVSSVVSDTLAAMIQGGELPVGSRLPPERELMRRFGISRTAVREGIAALAHRGLLLTRPGYRPVVRRPDYSTAFGTLTRLVEHLTEDEQGVWNLFETRIFLEAALARNAALRGKGGDIEEMGNALAANRSAIGEHPGFYMTDVAFHEMLYRMAANPIYLAIHRAYVEWLMSHWQAMPRGSDIDRMNYTAHEAIFGAIVARDADTAESLLRKHLETVWQFVRATF